MAPFFAKIFLTRVAVHGGFPELTKVTGFLKNRVVREEQDSPFFIV